MKDLTDRALQAAAVLVLFSLALRWTWDEVRPLAPVLIAGVSGWALLRFLSRRRNRW